MGKPRHFKTRMYSVNILHIRLIMMVQQRENEIPDHFVINAQDWRGGRGIMLNVVPVVLCMQLGHSLHLFITFMLLCICQENVLLNIIVCKTQTTLSLRDFAYRLTGLRIFHSNNQLRHC